jgi:hypothetical protein
MDDDRQTLKEMNMKIADAEHQGDREWLAAILAPRLAFQRADGQLTVDDQVAFLQKVKPDEPGVEKRKLSIEAIELYGNRAVVRCIVAVGERRFDNLRLFVRREGGWKLLGWANEPV